MNDVAKTNDLRTPPNPGFAHPANRSRLMNVAAALEKNNIAAFVVASRDAARTKIHGLIPKGAEVFTTTSRTLDELGVAAELNEAGHHDAVRPKLMKMDRNTQHHEMRELGARPAYVVGSVHAVTDDGVVIAASMSGSQLGPYASGSAHVIWVVGAQKVVKNIDEGLQRIEEYSLPMEDERMRGVYGMGSAIGKILIIKREVMPGRSTLILLEDVIGF
jgi:L-lactate utilization protein LutC